jgi:transposase
LVAALAPDGLHEPWLIEGAMDTESFAWYITEQLAPTLRPGQVVVVDNLSAHKADRIRHAIAARGCQLLFLPPYSPDFTPIEQAFSKGHPARTGRAHQGGAPRSGSSRHRGDYPTRCSGVVRPRWVRSVCSSYLKVAL